MEQNKHDLLNLFMNDLTITDLKKVLKQSKNVSDKHYQLISPDYHFYDIIAILSDKRIVTLNYFRTIEVFTINRNGYQIVFPRRNPDVPNRIINSRSGLDAFLEKNRNRIFEMYFRLLSPQYILECINITTNTRTTKQLNLTPMSKDCSTQTYSSSVYTHELPKTKLCVSSFPDALKIDTKHFYHPVEKPTPQVTVKMINNDKALERMNSELKENLRKVETELTRFKNINLRLESEIKQLENLKFKSKGSKPHYLLPSTSIHTDDVLIDINAASRPLVNTLEHSSTRRVHYVDNLAYSMANTNLMYAFNRHNIKLTGFILNRQAFQRFVLGTKELFRTEYNFNLKYILPRFYEQKQLLHYFMFIYYSRLGGKFVRDIRVMQRFALIYNECALSDEFTYFDENGSSNLSTREKNDLHFRRFSLSVDVTR